MKRQIMLSCSNLLLLSLALSKFAYASFEEANGLLEWKDSMQIPDNSPMSSWTSTAMNSTNSPWSGVVLNDDGTIQKLYLPYYGLNGTLNQFPFSFLHNLTRFELSVNHLFGPIPAQIRLLSKLAYLDLSGNMFAGVIPPEIGMLANLETLHLFENQLNGSIPQEIGQLRKLAYLYLGDNMLSGQIPHEFGQLVNLVELHISNNSLNGNIPRSIRNLKSLKCLSLHYNKLSGHIPQGVLTSLNLLEIHLDNNQLSGPLPEDLCHGGRLQYLSLSHNRLTGPIPIGLKNCSSLTKAFFNFNQFTGDISNSFGVYPNLSHFSVTHNNFHGNLSQIWSNKCKNLTRLGMGYNNINGYIPPEFGNSTQLQRLDLSSNNLVGEIPKEFGKMKDMQHLSLEDNQLSGVIPQELGSLHKMEQFDLSTNKLNGLIPKYIGEWEQILYLNLSNNKFSGKIPSEIGKLSNLTTLDLSWNSFTEEIPNEIQSLMSLESLNLSHNRLSGSIPGAFGKFPRGVDVNLSYNELVGPVPTLFPIFMNSSFEAFKGNPGLCGNFTGMKLCESQIIAQKHNNSFPQRLILVIMLSLLGAIILLGLLIWKFSWRKKAEYNVTAENFLNSYEFRALKRYSYSQIHKITNSFEVKLGQGGFGSVYKGSLSNGNLVAVKILNESKDKGDDFVNEVASVSRTSHVNIVNLVGFCLEGRRSALIYEFMPNGSLEKFIYGQDSSSISQLEWKKLHQIAIGIARGLEYLHMGCNTRIVHFDIKPHNILLDQDFCPKISDFGLAKQLLEKRSMISLSCMRGTPGYIAPELVSRNFGQVSHKSDVYSYGMMILEMVVGRKNVKNDVNHTSEIYFPDWIYKKVESEEQLGLHGIVSDEENELVRKMIIVGLWCIQTYPLNRPAITKVLEMLEGGLELLEMPPKPCIFSPQRSGIVEELFEEGSAMLAERLGNDEAGGSSTSGLFICVVCQVDIAASEGISVHAGSIISTSSKPWQGPFLCADCRNKKDAMEGKQPSGVKVT